MRVGIVPYLNMLPLVHGLDRLRLEGPPSQSLQVISVPPSRMIEMMEAGEIDVGMAPAAGVFDHPEWAIVGSSMIGSNGRVKSVLAISKDPPEKWTLLHPDSHSRTSNALIQILLANRFGVRPRLGAPLPPDDWTPPTNPSPGEAFVLIGTRALRWRRLWQDSGGYALDLGRLWTTWTHLPFVYAVWAANPGAAAARWMDSFENLKGENRKRLAEYIGEWPGLKDEHLTPTEARDYLTRNITYDLDAPALEGLERFYQDGLKLGLFKRGWNLAQARKASSPSD